MEACAKAAAALDEGTTKLQLGSAVKRYWHFAFVIALAIVLWAPRLKGPIDLRWDAGVYYILGTSLATGHGYRILSEPGAPEAVQYPPLLPGIVALYERALGSTDPAVVGPWLRRSYAALFLVYGVAVLALAGKYLRPLFALAAAVLCLLHHSTIFLSDVLFTELPFALVSVVFVLLADGRGNERARWWREAISFFFATTGFLLRTAGIVLFAAWIIEATLRRRWQLAATRLLLAFLPIALWQAHVVRVHQSDEYRHPAYEYQRAPYQSYNVTYADNMLLLDPLRPELGRATPSALAARLAKNFRYVVKAAGESMSASDFYWRQGLSKLLFGLRLIVGSIVLIPIVGSAILAAAGLSLLVRGGRWLFVLYVIGSIAIICTAPWRVQFLRYLAPVAPFLVMAAAVTVARLAAAAHSRHSSTTAPVVINFVLATVLALLLAVQVYAASRLFSDRAQDGISYVPAGNPHGTRFFYHDKLWRGWEQAIDWINKNAAPEAIIATRRGPHLCYLQTGRFSIATPIESSMERASHLLESVPVSYVIADREYRFPAVENNPQKWHLVETFAETQLYVRNAILSK
jgi:hypothetical protein